jgi:predicted TPR repeat methyltransferase
MLWNKPETIAQAVREYQQQATELSRLMAEMQAQMNEMQAQALRIDGAVIALNQLLQNQKDEEATASPLDTLFPIPIRTAEDRDE